jgi:hypothetical protein
MPVYPIPAEREEQLRRAMLEQVRAARRHVAVQNGEAARGLRLWTRWAFRGRVFDTPPVPWQDGVKLIELQVRLAELHDKEVSTDTMQALLTIYEECLPIFRRNVRPVALLDRLLWRWLCRMKSGVTYTGLVERTR